MKKRGPFTMYYDAGCPFCIRMVRVFRGVLGLRGSKCLPAQSDPARHEEMREAKSWIVVAADGEHLHGWRAVSVVVSESSIFWPVGKLIGSRPLLPIGESFYGWIERNRPMLSKLTGFMSTDLPD
jgi:predicted DCC family thiol-disulfide oxidoreductase YuxK